MAFPEVNVGDAGWLLLPPLLADLLAQALVWWFPVLLRERILTLRRHRGKLRRGEIMNDDSDLRYSISNKRQLEAEEDSGTNSNLTEKPSSVVRHLHGKK